MLCRYRSSAVLLALFLAGCLKLATLPSKSPPVPAIAPSPEPQIEYQSYSLPNSLVRTVTVPASGQWIATTAVSTGVDFLEEFVREGDAIAAINGGFFDPNNQKSTSYVFRNGQMVADPEQNERLTNNPQLAPYTKQIFNRSEWRRYQCDREVRYAIALRQEPSPAGCQLVDAIGGGPRLLPTMTAEAEAFMTPNRDPLGIDRRNARSAVGITEDGSLIFAIAAQIPNNPPSGLSLPEFAEFLRSLGAISALNLDGGSSTSLYYRGQTFYGKLDEAGNALKRPVKSVIQVNPNFNKLRLM